MFRKAISVFVAVALVFTLAIVAVGDADAAAGDKKVKKSSANKAGQCPGSSAAQAAKACGTKAANAGCSKAAAADCAKFCSKTASAGKCCKAGMSACCAGAKRAVHSAALKKVVDDIPYRESKRLVLTGKVMCGKCGLGELELCQPMIKTEGGKLYPIAKNALARKMRGCQSENAFKISTRVKRIDGVKYLEVTSFTAL